MSRVCPADGSGCPDDLCRSMGCAKCDNYPMLAICPVCQGTVDEEGDLDMGSCICDEDDDFF